MNQNKTVQEAWADFKQSFNFAKDTINAYLLKKTYKQIIWVLYSFSIERGDTFIISTLTPRWLWVKLCNLQKIETKLKIKKENS